MMLATAEEVGEFGVGVELCDSCVTCSDEEAGGLAGDAGAAGGGEG